MASMADEKVSSSRKARMADSRKSIRNFPPDFFIVYTREDLLSTRLPSLDAVFFFFFFLYISKNINVTIYMQTNIHKKELQVDGKQE